MPTQTSASNTLYVGINSQSVNLLKVATTLMASYINSCGKYLVSLQVLFYHTMYLHTPKIISHFASREKDILILNQ